MYEHADVDTYVCDRIEIVCTLFGESGCCIIYMIRISNELQVVYFLEGHIFRAQMVGGEKSLLCHPGSELRLGGRE